MFTPHPPGYSGAREKIAHSPFLAPALILFANSTPVFALNCRPNWTTASATGQGPFICEAPVSPTRPQRVKREAWGAVEVEGAEG